MSELRLIDLKELDIPSRVVKIDDETGFKVQGLPYNKMMELFGEYLGYVDNLLDGDTATIGKMIQESPELVSQVIAEAAGSPEMADKVMMLGAQIQGQALIEIFTLTFPDSDLLGKLWERLTQAVTAATLAYQNQQAARITGGDGSKQ